MFGYIKPKHTELRVREHECYKGAYCGLCHSMGKTCGRAFCGTLSYDFAFMAMVRMTLMGITPEFEQKRCIAHPFRKRNSVKDNDALQYCSGAAALLGYRKCLDDVNDEKGFSKLKARLALPFFKGARRRALKRLPGLEELDVRIKEHLDALSAIEGDKESEPSADRPAEVFGNIVADILSFGLEGSKAKIGAALGHATGHWIYLVDAADDYSEDKKKGRYNPFILLWGDSEITPESWDRLKDALISVLMDAERALDLFDFSNSREFSEIMRNILYLGMPAEAEKVFDRNKKEDK